MRNTSKISTLEAKFPLLAVENGCLVSKDADLTIAFKLELPELFTLTESEYEAMHSAWHKAIKVLPNYSIVHKQDWFIQENYAPELNKGELSFLARASERHFNERPYLHHAVYLFLTKTTKKRMAQQSNFSALCRGHLIPKDIEDKDAVAKFLEAVDQFERIINDSDHLRLTRMTEDELIGTKEKAGLLDRYFSLSESQHASLEDIRLGADLVRVGDQMVCLHTLSDTDDLPTSNRNKFILGPSGSGKSFFTNHMVRQYYEQGAHVLLVDTGNSYQGLCELIHRKTKGADGVYFTYTDESPISFNPFYTDDYVFDVEKRESICTLLLTLWKSADEPLTKTEAGELGSAVNAYIERIRADHSITPCFNTFYEYLRDVYRKEMEEREIKVTLQDFNINNLLTTLKQYYRGGRYDFLLNSTENIDLLSKRFIVFEIDQVKDNKDLFPVVTIIIMEAFINKMRRLKGIRKMILIEEAWKAIASANMADYIKYLYKTVRKYFGEAIVVTQEVDDIIQSPIVKESIINNSDCKILLDQRKYMTKFDGIQAMLGLSEKEKSQILSINQNNDPHRLYKEVWIGLGGMQSAVYATEVSLEEYLTYTTEETEKVEVLRLAEQLGGDIEAAIRQLAREKRHEE